MTSYVIRYFHAKLNVYMYHKDTPGGRSSTFYAHHGTRFAEWADARAVGDTFGHAFTIEEYHEPEHPSTRCDLVTTVQPVVCGAAAPQAGGELRREVVLRPLPCDVQPEMVDRVFVDRRYDVGLPTGTCRGDKCPWFAGINAEECFCETGREDSFDEAARYIVTESLRCPER